jgi:putative N6-adenine-specific DNA methylase
MEETFDIVVKTMHGLEDVLAGEIKSLGGKNIRIERRAVVFEGDKEALYKANYFLRTALKVLKPVLNFSAKNEVDLYTNVSRINWADYIKKGDTIAVDPVVNSTHFNHSMFVAQKVKDAVVDQLRKETGRRPSVDTDDPSCRLNIHISNSDCTLSLDSSGESLHKRGYRYDGNIAPINEVLAAGMILLSGWKGDSDFYDMMCGSGTLLIEAAMIAKNLPPGLFRKHFAFESWNDFDPDLFDEVADDYTEKKFEHKIIGGDMNLKALTLARTNIRNAMLNKVIELKNTSFFDYEPESNQGVIMMNPPYGERIKVNNLMRLYNGIGSTLKHKYAGFDAWIISSNKDALKKVGLRTSDKITLFNGKLECKFHHYSLYSGSKKQSKN